MNWSLNWIYFFIKGKSGGKIGYFIGYENLGIIGKFTGYFQWDSSR